MERATGQTHKDHAQHALQSVVVMLDALDDEVVQLDGVLSPSFEEWLMKGVNSAWFAQMAPTNRQDTAVWLALWKSYVAAITLEFMYKTPWKKLEGRQRVWIVKDEGCTWCGA